MNWYKAKTILIVFLVIINAALLTYISADSYKLIKNENRVIDTVINLLSDKDISVDRQTIDKAEKKDSLKNIYASNVIYDYQSFSELLFASEVKKVNENEYACEKGTVKYSGDSFYAKASSGNSLFSFQNGKNLRNLAKNYLLTLGIDVSGINPVTTEDGEKTTLSFGRKIDGMEVFGTGITVVISNLGITAVSGTWHEYSKSDVKTELKGISSVLIDYMNLHPPTQTPVTITSLSLGYATLEAEVYHKGISLIPMWKITDDRGNSEYIDARENL